MSDYFRMSQSQTFIMGMALGAGMGEWFSILTHSTAAAVFFATLAMGWILAGVTAQ